MTKLSENEKRILKDSREADKIKNRKRTTKVHHLKDEQYVPELEILVLRRYPPRIISSRKWTGRVAAACGRDETGVVGLVLWNEQIDKVATGDIVRIENGWCKRRLGERVVSTGRNGRLSIIND
ncbi:MAG TPA: hypothetical protein QF508_01550 [Candidatus Thalassarchaeaceae archaeon]|jgi:ssDNA-binding replication factor A large subunit|nr:hypothetical protein [Candidatus Thalassarchaeaceae archaeon]HJO42073.1 hypothetical protein [Candidatus Thalassarchaeaceae archaeon]|tara:strand:- start:444 stop:815 length:372 start_codon:yes stop_codon:yes gene_type:complete